MLGYGLWKAKAAGVYQQYLFVFSVLVNWTISLVSWWTEQLLVWLSSRWTWAKFLIYYFSVGLLLDDVLYCCVSVCAVCTICLYRASVVGLHILFGLYGGPNRPNRKVRSIRVRFPNFFKKLRSSVLKTQNFPRLKRPNRLNRVDRMPSPKPCSPVTPTNCPAQAAQ
jgi:hypothetical protein